MDDLVHSPFLSPKLWQCTFEPGGCMHACLDGWIHVRMQIEQLHAAGLMKGGSLKKFPLVCSKDKGWLNLLLCFCSQAMLAQAPRFGQGFGTLVLRQATLDFLLPT